MVSLLVCFGDFWYQLCEKKLLDSGHIQTGSLLCDYIDEFLDYLTEKTALYGFTTPSVVLLMCFENFLIKNGSLQCVFVDVVFRLLKYAKYFFPRFIKWAEFISNSCKRQWICIHFMHIECHEIIKSLLCLCGSKVGFY